MEDFMQCHETNTRLRGNKLSLLLSILSGLIVVPAMAKDDIFQMLTKMETCLHSKQAVKSPSTEKAWAEWNHFRDNAKLSLEKFFDIQKYPTHSFDAQIDLYKEDLHRCHQLMQNAFFAPICTMLKPLHQELHGLIALIAPYRGTKNVMEMIAVVAKIRKFEYLMPKELRSKGSLAVLKHRIQKNCA